jgi:hypothetical protein
VQKLAAGPRAIYICDARVAACQAIMRGEGAGVSLAIDPSTWPKERLLAVLRPVEGAADAYPNYLQTIVETLRAQGVS